MSAAPQLLSHSTNLKNSLSFGSNQDSQTTPQEQTPKTLAKSHFISISPKYSKLGQLNLSITKNTTSSLNISTHYVDSTKQPEPKKLVAFRPRRKSPQKVISTKKVNSQVTETISSIILKGFKQIQTMVLFIVQAMDTFFVTMETFFVHLIKEFLELEDSRNLALMSWLLKVFSEKKYLSITCKKPKRKLQQQCQPPQMKKQENKPLTLVLDLDETLIHSSTTKPKVGNYHTISVLKDSGVFQQVYIKKRPYLDHFLTKVAEHFNLVVFTASHINYANSAIDLIDENFVIPKRLYRQSCSKTENGWAKNLTKIEQDLTKVILLDNCDVAGSLQPENHLLIDSWFYNENDDCLLTYAELLVNYANRYKTEVYQHEKDVRKYIQEHLNQKQIFAKTDTVTLIH